VLAGKTPSSMQAPLPQASRSSRAASGDAVQHRIDDITAQVCQLAWSRRNSLKGH